MSGEPPPAAPPAAGPPPRRRWFRFGRVLGCATLLVVGIAVSLSMFVVFPIQVVINLAAGWAYYLARVLPQVRLKPWPVAVALLCLVGLAVGGHRFLCWLQASRPDGAARPWRWRWTMTGLALFVAFFAASIATIGVVHQLAWLSREPFLAEGRFAARSKQRRAMSDLRSIGIAVESYRVDAGHLPAVASGRAAALRPLLEPTYIPGLPLADPWGQPYRWRHLPGTSDYSVVCWGKDRSRDPAVTPGATTDLAADIYFSDGAFTVYPEGTQD